MTARRSLAKTARAERVPKINLEPVVCYRPQRHEKKEDEVLDDPVVVSETALLFIRLHTAFAIQERCGFVRLTESEAGQLSALDEIIKKKPRSAARDAVLIAADRLVESVACSHCIARDDCQRGRA